MAGTSKPSPKRRPSPTDPSSLKRTKAEAEDEERPPIESEEDEDDETSDSNDEWDGTLTEEEFRDSVDLFCERWKKMDTGLPEFTWIPFPRPAISAPFDADGFLVWERVPHCDKTNELNDGQTHTVAASVPRRKKDMHFYDYHITYNFSWKVPVLYFRGYHGDNWPLTWAEIKKDLPPQMVKHLSKTRYLTPEDHPYLGRPWLRLDPFDTADWMSCLIRSHLPNKQHYLPAWLSVVGTEVGVTFPIESCRRSVVNDVNAADGNSFTSKQMPKS